MADEAQESNTEETTSESEALQTDEKIESTTEGGEEEVREGEESEQKPEEVDYKAELESAETQIKQAEHTIVELKKDAKKSVDPADLSKKVAEEVRKDLAQDAFEEALLNITENDDERKLILFHYNNTIRPSGFSRNAIASDLQRAKLLANEKKIFTQVEELRRTATTKANTGATGMGNSQSRQRPAAKPNLSSADTALLEKYGIDPSEVKHDIE